MVIKFLAVFFLCALPMNPSAFAREIKSAEEALRLGDTALMNGLHDKSEQYYLRAAELKPKDAAPVLRLASYSYEVMKFNDAKRLWDKAARLKRDKTTQKLLALLLKKISEAEPTLTALERAYSLGDTAKVWSLQKQAATLMSQEPVLMVLLAPHLKYLLAQEPQNLRILSALAEGYYLSSDPTHAYFYYKDLVTLAPPQLVLYERFAEVAVLVGAFDEARLAYKKALRQAVLAGDTDAIRRMLDVQKKLPTFSDKIDVLVENKSYSEAFKELRKCLSRNPSHPWAVLQMARLYQELGRLGQAEKLYRQALEWRPEDPSAHYTLAQFYLYQKKDFELALAEFKEARVLLAENRSLSSKPSDDKKWKEGIRGATRAIYGVYLEVLRKPRSAALEIEWLVKKEWAEAQDYYALGVAYTRLQKRSSAYQSFKKVIELDPKSEAAKDAEAIIETIRSESKKGFPLEANT